ncbi:hypothetical protein K3495_g11399 [Podosphaera aphanis]|nr:hypothetical protein K3495_g11399 [Podosphaera aphanis]
MKEHRDHVRQVVSRQKEAGLQIDINKCEFEPTGTKYLGLIITPEGIEMDIEKVVGISHQSPLFHNIEMIGKAVEDKLHVMPSSY